MITWKNCTKTRTLNKVSRILASVEDVLFYLHEVENSAIECI